MNDYKYSFEPISIEHHIIYYQLISKLTDSTYISKEYLEDVLKEIKSQGGKIYMIKFNDKIVGTGKIIIERKLYSLTSYVGHIEDVVIHSSYRNLGLGKKIVEYLLEVGKKAGCYKIVLSCNDENKSFYEKVGLSKSINQMALYFDK